MTEIRIREAAVEDAASIAKIHVETWQHAYRGQIPDTYLDGLSVERRAEGHWARLANPPAKSHTLIALADDQIVGFCIVGASQEDDADDTSGELYAIYVDPRFIGKGVGSALIAEGVRKLHDEKFARATLWVLASNTPSRQFYEHHGWVADGASKTDTRADFELHEVRYALDLV